MHTGRTHTVLLCSPYFYHVVPSFFANPFLFPFFPYFCPNIRCSPLFSFFPLSPPIYLCPSFISVGFFFLTLQTATSQHSNPVFNIPSSKRFFSLYWGLTVFPLIPERGFIIHGREGLLVFMVYTMAADFERLVHLVHNTYTGFSTVCNSIRCSLPHSRYVDRRGTRKFSLFSLFKEFPLCVHDSYVPYKIVDFLYRGIFPSAFLVILIFSLLSFFLHSSRNLPLHRILSSALLSVCIPALIEMN